MLVVRYGKWGPPDDHEDGAFPPHISLVQSSQTPFTIRMLSARRCPFCIPLETFICLVNTESLPHFSGSLFLSVQDARSISSSGALYTHDEYWLHTARDTQCNQVSPTKHAESAAWTYFPFLGHSDLVLYSVLLARFHECTHVTFMDVVCVLIYLFFLSSMFGVFCTLFNAILPRRI